MKRLFWLLPVVLALVPSSGLAGEADGRDLRVPTKFATIQDAVDAAAAGDVIAVAPGVYCENVIVSKSDLTIRPQDDEHGAAPVLSGECAPAGPGAGTGFKVLGTAAVPVENVRISGFVVKGFEVGILLQYVVRSRVSGNEVAYNERSGGTPANQNGVLLVNASFNEISRNDVHNNGHMGIGVRASHANAIRGNRLIDNQTQYAGSCSLMLYGGSVGNQVVGNEVIDAVGNGIMVGPAGAAQNLVAGNGIHGHTKAGIQLVAGSQPNVIFDNDVTGNGLGGVEPDLIDYNSPSTNIWLGNLGTCHAGNAGC